MVNRWDRVLPNQLFGGHFRAEAERLGPHVPVGELEPGPGKGVGEGLGVLVEVTRDRRVDRIEAQR